jgi:hypothetical protein
MVRRAPQYSRMLDEMLQAVVTTSETLCVHTNEQPTE